MSALHEWIGSAAGLLTTVAFVPQVLKTWRSKSANDLSFAMLGAFSLGLVLWLVYGLLIGAWPVVIANAVTLLLAGAILWMKLRYQR
jgi:MtN3 and saliva related transmembrane protein